MHVVVVGPGLIGRSVTLAVRRADPRAQVTEVDQGEPLRATDADVVVLAAPVHAILTLLRSDAEAFRGTLTIDTGSTKREIIRTARQAGLTAFVGGHPMAGGAGGGAAGARADLFDAHPWFLIPHGAPPEATAGAAEFVRSLGARPVLLDDDGAEHDRVMAAVSHLPQVVSSLLMIVADGAARDRLAWAGPGLRDTTRLAASRAEMWESVLHTNAGELRPLLWDLARRLTDAAAHLEDDAAVRALFEQANAARERLASAAAPEEKQIRGQRDV